MYFIFTSFWNGKVRSTCLVHSIAVSHAQCCIVQFYYVYGFMLLVYLILIIVTICVTVVAVYFLLNAEDHRWQWTAFYAAGSTAAYVYAYAIFYYFFKTNMSGFLQACFYFGYMALFCTALFILCGTLGVVGSTAFVKRIYRNIKCD